MFNFETFSNLCHFNPDQFYLMRNQRVFDKEHRKEKAFNIHQYDKSRRKLQFEDFDTARQRASTLKWRVTENLDKYLD